MYLSIPSHSDIRHITQDSERIRKLSNLITPQWLILPVI